MSSRIGNYIIMSGELVKPSRHTLERKRCPSIFNRFECSQNYRETSEYQQNRKFVRAHMDWYIPHYYPLTEKNYYGKDMMIVNYEFKLKDDENIYFLGCNLHMMNDLFIGKWTWFPQSLEYNLYIIDDNLKIIHSDSVIFKYDEFNTYKKKIISEIEETISIPIKIAKIMTMLYYSDQICSGK
jgi:hypothetical protein